MCLGLFGRGGECFIFWIFVIVIDRWVWVEVGVLGFDLVS